MAFSATSFSSSEQKLMRSGRRILSCSLPPKKGEKLVISSKTAIMMGGSSSKNSE